MSFFRRRAAKPLVALSLSVAVLAGLSTPTFAETKDDIRKKQSKVNKDLKDAKNDVKSSEAKAEAAAKLLKQSEKRLEGAVANLRATRGRLLVAQSEDARIRKELDASEAKLLAGEKRLAKAEKSLDTSTSEVERFTVESVLHGDSGLRAFGDLLKGEDPITFTDRISAQVSVSDAQLARMQVLDASRVLLEVERAELEELRNLVAQQKAKAEEQVAAMASLTSQAEAQQVEVAELVDENSKARKEADAALADDRAVQAAFERERRALETRLQKIIDEELRKADKNPTKPPAVNNGSTFSRPVTGRISSQYGMRRHPILGTYKIHDGTDFAAPCGTPIWAAASGTVVQRYYNSAYGNRIVVNHGVMRGVSAMTTYNHLSRYNVTNGQTVTRGQVIGYVGTTGLSTGCHLHFMVLQNGKHTNPMNWL
ncbi:MAG: peptidoglycan DD-metalloendopeptidase family protein [Actinomycetales bacterium]|nr:peptidoglycan DD-metalloendopeptidase family protein [Actinomycetales bacterium]